jgi:hypothetical protein
MRDVRAKCVNFTQFTAERSPQIPQNKSIVLSEWIGMKIASLLAMGLVAGVMLVASPLARAQNVPIYYLPGINGPCYGDTNDATYTNEKKSFVLFLIVLLALGNSHKCSAQGMMIFDQSSSTTNNSGEFLANIQANQPIGQSFTPSRRRGFRAAIRQ